jgi:hypothetical protein
VAPPRALAAHTGGSTSGFVPSLKRVGVAVSEGSAAASALYLVVVLFLAVQDRIDRNDPKLALAPVFGVPDLPFESPPRPGDEAL